MEKHRFKTVYYSNFWYSRYYKPPVIDFDGNLISHEVDLHKVYLRLLSIFFDTIYIPRTHFITQSFTLQHKIPDALLDADEFNFLLNKGVLKISSYPGLDAYQDNERILGRQGLSSRVVYPQDKDFLRKIPITEIFEVDTSREATSNSISFPEYGEILMIHNKEVGQKFLELTKEAQIGDIPFFHEHFVNRLREEFEPDVFQKIWRETNSIYLTSGAPEHDDFIAYFNEEIESSNFRFKPYGVDRYLYSPPSLYSFLSIFLSSEYMWKFLYASIEKTHGNLLSESAAPTLSKFRDEFQKIVDMLSLYTRAEAARYDLSQQTISSLFEGALDGRFRASTKFADSVAEDIFKISRTIDSESAGLASTLIRSGLNYGGGFLKNLARANRFPAISQVLKELKTNLRYVGLT